MTYVITQLSQSVQLSGVTDVAVTDVQYDATAGDYWREIRVFATEGESGGAEAVVYTLRLRGASLASIEVTAPSFEF